MSSLYFEKKKSFPFKRNELLVEQYFVTSQLWSSVTYHTISIISLLFVANTISSHTPSQYPPIPHHNILPYPITISSHTPTQYPPIPHHNILPYPITISSHTPTQYPPIPHHNILPYPITISSHTPSQYPPIPHHNILHTPSQYHLPIVCKLVLVVNVAEILII